MIFQRTNVRRRLFKVATLVLSGASLVGLLQSCDDRLIGLTQFFDPCATFLANCNPGDFQVRRADVGDYCIDPACSVPGQCDNIQPLGTITDVCP